MSALLHVKNLSAGYGGGDVIRGISFELAPGELCALLGSNGCGKSTLLRAVCGLLKSRGELEAVGRPVAALSQRERARRIGYLAQRGGGGLSIPALDMVLMGLNPELGLLQTPGESHRWRALEALAWAGAEELAEQNFSTLSEGQKQLVLLARTVVRTPPLLVLDEPDSALDVQNRGQVMALLGEYLGRGGRSVLLCSHDVNAALEHASRLLLMKEGRLLCDLRPGELSRGELEGALQRVYGPVEVLEHRGRFLMIGGDST